MTDPKERIQDEAARELAESVTTDYRPIGQVQDEAAKDLAESFLGDQKDQDEAAKDLAESFLGDQKKCAFCKIAQHEAPADIYYENSMVMAFKPLKPAVEGHILVIPKVHVPDFLILDGHTAGVLMNACITIGRDLFNEYEAEGMNLITSAGEAATQSIFHLHIHLLPRKEGDQLMMWPEKAWIK